VVAAAHGEGAPDPAGAATATTLPENNGGVGPPYRSAGRGCRVAVRSEVAVRKLGLYRAQACPMCAARLVPKCPG